MPAVPALPFLLWRGYPKRYQGTRKELLQRCVKESTGTAPKIAPALGKKRRSRAKGSTVTKEHR